MVEVTEESAPRAAPRLDAVPGHVWRVAAVVIVGAFMTQLDAALVNVGLATVARDLSASLSTTQWIVSAYLLALVIGLPLCGWASRRFGASTVWTGALAAFTVASVLCAWAASVEMLIAARFLQGLAAGLLLPAGQTVIAHAAGRALMGRVMSTAGMALVLGPALGPVVGGELLAHAAWPWLFLINVPVGVVGLWLGRRILPRTGPSTGGERTRFDATGFALLGLALPAVTYATSGLAGPADLGRVAVYGPLLVGVGGLALFAVRARRSAAPLLDVRLFAGPAFRAAAVASFLAGAVQFGSLVIWALYFQFVRGYDVVGAGLAMAGFALGAALLPVTGRLTDRHGGGPVALGGAVLTTATLLPMAVLPASTGLGVLEACLFLLGVANACSVVPVSTAAYVSIEPRSVPDAVTIINIFLRLGGAVGAALLVAVLDGGSAGGTAGGGAGAAAGIGGFHAAFWCLTGLGLLSVAACGALTAAARRGR